MRNLFFKMRRRHRDGEVLSVLARAGPTLEILESRIVLAAGDLDLSFGIGGLASSGFTTTPLLDTGMDAAMQADGKLVLVGTATDGYSRYKPDFLIARVNADGSPDTGFGRGGQVLTDFGGSDYSQESANAVAIQADGKIVVAGRAQLGTGFDFALARYNTDGTLDASFDGDGFVTTDLGGSDDEAFDVAIQADGSIVVAGRSGGKFALARYTSSGALDTAFDTDGMVMTSFSGSDGAHALLIQPDGKIVAAGSDGTDFTMARYHADGSLDAGFGSDGMVVTNFGYVQIVGVTVDRSDLARGLARQSDGKLVVAGESESDAALARYNTDGTLDTTFGSGGLLTAHFGSAEGFNAVAIQTDGKIVATGMSQDAVLVARYNPDGSPDTSFDGDGHLSKNLGDRTDTGNTVLVAASGKLLVAGSLEDQNRRVQDAVLLQFNADGSADSGFGDAGTARVDGLGAGEGSPFATLVQADGKVLVAGEIGVQPGQADTNGALMRFNADGSLDTTFGIDGSATTGFTPLWKDRIQALAQQPDGRIIVVGNEYPSQLATDPGPGGTATDNVFLARYNHDGSLDPTFGAGGKVIASFSDGADTANAVLIQPDGKIVIGGGIGGPATEEFGLAGLLFPQDVMLARYNADGTLDATFGTAGIARADFGAPIFDEAIALARQSDGSLVVAAGHPYITFLVGRFDASGAFDTTFGSGGTVAINLSGGDDVVSSLLVQPDDTIVVGGEAGNALGLLKLTADGGLDTSFGNGGAVFTGLGGGGWDLLRQADGKIMATLGAEQQVTVARFTATGAFDLAFGEGGVATAAAPNGSVAGAGAGLDAAGRVVVGVNSFGNYSSHEFGAFRFQTDLLPPPQGAFTFSATTFVTAENAGTATVTVLRTGGTTGAVDVSYVVSAGTATAGSDFVSITGTLHFADGENTQTFDVTILTDSVEEGAETIRLALSNATGGAAVDNPKTATLTIAGEATEAGLIDPGFGINGIATGQTEANSTLGFFEFGAAASVVLQPDGKLIVAGTSPEDETSNWILERYNRDGTLDTTFGVEGSVTTDFAGQSDYATEVFLLADGRIIVAGVAGEPAASTDVGFGSSRTAALARYNPDGTLDTTFGNLGRAYGDFLTDLIADAAIQPDGKIVLIGEMRTSPLCRYNADGTSDTTFGTDGSVAGNGAMNNQSIVIQPDGKIVAAGSLDPDDNDNNTVALTRWNADGTLDTSFGKRGMVSTDLGPDGDDEAYAVTLDADGKIVVTGETHQIIGGTKRELAFVARYTSAGALDTTFDTDGFNTVMFPASFWTDSRGDAVFVQEDGKIIVGGKNEPFAAGMGVARFNPDGTLNTSFGTNGRTIVEFDKGFFPGTLLLQPDEKIVVAGVMGDASGIEHLALVRFLADPQRGAFQFSTAAFTVDENAGTATITVLRTGGVEGAATVGYTVGNGTAQEGSDFVPTAGTLSFADGEDTQTFTIPLIDNNAVEGRETVTLTLSAPSLGAKLGALSTSVLTIYDGPGTLQFAQQQFFVGEHFGNAPVTVTRTGGSDGVVSIELRTRAGSATENLDYVPVVETVTFADGDTTPKTVSIPVLDDRLLEGVEALEVTLGAPAGAELGTPAVVTLKLFDQETGQPHNAGAPDWAYGGDGFATAGFNPAATNTVFDMVIQHDGKAVIVGGTRSGTAGDFAVARFNADGTLDATFSGDGRTTIDFAAGFDEARGVVLQPDGKLVIAGSSIAGGRSNFALARLNADGSPDTTFGTGGLVTTDFAQNDDRAHAVTLDSDGRILVVGSSGGVFARDFALARYNPDGTLDTTFDKDGRVTTDFDARFDEAEDLLVQPDGKIVVVGGSIGVGTFYDVAWSSSSDFAVARYNVNGSLDKSFDRDGKVQTDFNRISDNIVWDNDHAYAVVLQPDGQIVVGGSSDDNFLLARYTTTGSIDTSFGQSGPIWSGMPVLVGGKGSSNTLYDLFVQPDGKLVAVGSSRGGIGVTRLDANGTPLDADFGTSGVFTNSTLAGGYAGAWHDQRLYVAGTSGGDFAVGRFLAEQASPPNGTFNFSQQYFTVEENAGRATITVTRPFYAALGTATVDYAIGGGSAMPGRDFTLVSDTLTFIAGETAKTFDVPIINDTLNEGWENLSIFIFNPTGGAELGSFASATLSIIDNDAAPQRGSLSVSGSTVTENGGAVTISVSRYGGSLGAASVNYVTTDGMAKAGEDYTFAKGTLSFASGETYKTFNVPILDDGALEGDEAFNVTLLKATGGVSISGRTSNVTIIDYEPVTCHNAGDLDTTFDTDGKLTTDFGQTSNEFLNALALQADGKILAAGRSGGTWALARYNADGSLDITFDTDGKVTTDVAANEDSAIEVFALAGGKTLVAGSSFDGVRESIAFARYNANGSLDTSFGKKGLAVFPLPHYDSTLLDFALQPDGKVIVAGQVPNGQDTDLAVVRFNANGTLDTTFGVNGEFYYDGGGYESATGVIVQPDGRILLNGSANGSSFLRLNTNGTFDTTFGTGGILPASVLSGSFSDMLFQPDGKLLLASGGDAVIKRVKSDFTLDPTFGIGGEATADFRSYFSAAKLALEPNGRIILTGTSSGDFAAARFYDDGVLDIGFGSGGIALTNFGGTEASSDVLVQPDGKIVLGGLANSSGNFALLRYVGGTSVGALRLDAPTYTVSENGGSLTVTVLRTCGMDGAVSVQYSTSNGTAQAGTDYAATSGTFTWADRDATPRTITIPITDDEIAQGNLTINVALSNPTGGAMLDGVSSAVATILDDDVPGRFSLAEPFVTVNEGDGTASITILRTDGRAGPVSVDLTATSDTAIHGSDFNFTTLTVNFADKETSRTVTIPILNDSAREADESFQIALSNPQGGATLGNIVDGEVGITDDDPLAYGVLEFAGTKLRVNEGDGSAMLTVRRTGGADGDVLAILSVTGGTARSGLDFAAEPAVVLEFAAGQTEASVMIPIIDDLVGETDETVSFELSYAFDGATLGAKTFATLTIADNDAVPPGVISLTSPKFTAPEGAGLATITLQRTGGSAGTASVHLETGDGTALSPSDYTATSLTVDFADGEILKTVTVPIRRDLLSEKSETFTVTLSSPSGDVTLGTQTAATVTIRDDDASPILDFNNDGDLDLVLVRKGKLNLHLGNGDGTFAATPSLVVAPLKSLTSFIAGDFNGDGDADLLAFSKGKHQVAVLAGNGDGTFDAADLSTTAKTAKLLVAADFNNDSRLDLAAIETAGVDVMLNRGNGKFSAPVIVSPGKGYQVLLSGDFDGDGNMDLAATKAGAKPTVTVLAGEGDGTFGKPVVSKIAKNMKSLLAADVTGDGILDLAAILPKNKLGFAPGYGQGAFGAVASIITSKGPKLLAVGDLNDDLTNDLLTSNTGKIASVIANSGGGAFGVPTAFNVGFQPNFIHLCDLDHDDDPDLLMLTKAGAFKVALGGAGTSFQVI